MAEAKLKAQLPDPLTPPDSDLRDYPSMLLDVVRLRDGKIMLLEDAEAFRTSVLSWCISWHQVPSASLPDDDRELARLLGYGKDVNSFKAIRAAGGLYGWVLCSDGRLYHPVVAEKANEALLKRKAQRERTEAARAAKEAAKMAKEASAHKDKSGTNGAGRQGGAAYPPFEPIDIVRAATPVTENVTLSTSQNVTENATGTSRSVTESVTGSKLSEVKVSEVKGREVHTSMYVPGTQDSRARAEPAQPPERRNMPRLGDPPAAWVPIAGSFELDDGMCGPVKKPVVNGFYLDEMAELVCSAAGISQRGYSDNWLILCSWLNAGYCPHRQIAPEIKRVDALRRSSLRSKGQSESCVDSIVYFDKPVRKLVPMLTPLHGRNVA